MRLARSRSIAPPLVDGHGAELLPAGALDVLLLDEPCPRPAPTINPVKAGCGVGVEVKASFSGLGPAMFMTNALPWGAQLREYVRVGEPTEFEANDGFVDMLGVDPGLIAQ